MLVKKGEHLAVSKRVRLRGAEEIYAEWIMRAVHPGWSARKFLLKFGPFEALQMTSPIFLSIKLKLPSQTP